MIVLFVQVIMKFGGCYEHHISKVVEYIKKFKVLRPACDFNRILNKYTRFFDFRFELKNSLSDDTISLDDLLDISTTN